MHAASRICNIFVGGGAFWERCQNLGNFCKGSNFGNSQPNVGLYNLPRKLDEEVARIHLKHLDADLTKLSKAQAEYIGVNINGPFKKDEYRY